MGDGFTVQIENFWEWNRVLLKITLWQQAWMGLSPTQRMSNKANHLQNQSYEKRDFSQSVIGKLITQNHWQIKTWQNCQVKRDERYRLKSFKNLWIWLRASWENCWDLWLFFFKSSYKVKSEVKDSIPAVLSPSTICTTSIFYKSHFHILILLNFSTQPLNVYLFMGFSSTRK